MKRVITTSVRSAITTSVSRNGLRIGDIVHLNSCTKCRIVAQEERGDGFGYGDTWRVNVCEEDNGKRHDILIGFSGEMGNGEYTVTREMENGEYAATKKFNAE
jgi:hypothetical protein